MLVNGNFHGPAVVAAGKETAVLTEYEAGWAPQLLLDAVENRNISFPCLKSKLDSSVVLVIRLLIRNI
jgi:hypothetical protein